MWLERFNTLSLSLCIALAVHHAALRCNGYRHSAS